MASKSATCRVADADAPAAACLQRVLPRWSVPEVPVHAVFPSTRCLTSKVRAFVDLVVGRFAFALPAPRAPRRSG